MEECNQKQRGAFDKFGILIPCSATFLLEVGACFSLKLATKQSFRCKKLRKCRFLCYFLKQKRINIYISIHCSATYFLKVGERVSLKVATKVSFRGTKICIFKAFSLKQKRRSATEKIDLFLTNSALDQNVRSRLAF